MPKKLHEEIKRSVKKAHPGYSKERVEQETNAVMANLGKGKVKRGKHMVKVRRVRGTRK